MTKELLEMELRIKDILRSDAELARLEMEHRVQVSARDVLSSLIGNYQVFGGKDKALIDALVESEEVFTKEADAISKRVYEYKEHKASKSSHLQT